MRKFVEDYSGLRIMLFLLSTLMSCLFLAPFVYSFNIGTSLYTVFYTLAISCVLLVYFYRIFEKYVNKIINTEINRKRELHIREFFSFLEEDEKFAKEVLRLPIAMLDSDGKRIGEHTIYQAYSRQFDRYIYKRLKE